MGGRQHVTEKQSLLGQFCRVLWSLHLCNDKGLPFAFPEPCLLQDQNLSFWTINHNVPKLFCQCWREVNLALDTESTVRIPELLLSVNFKEHEVHWDICWLWHAFSSIYLPGRIYSTTPDFIIFLENKNCHYQFSFAQSNDVSTTLWTRTIL